MAHEVQQGPHPFFKILYLRGDITHEDMTCVDEVGLNEGHPIYLLTDAAGMNAGMPDKFLETIRESLLYSPNLAHNAVYLPDSPVISTLAQMLIKLTRTQKKVSLFRNLDEAQDHLMKLMADAGV
jgi:hypothetical protein